MDCPNARPLKKQRTMSETTTDTAAGFWGEYHSRFAVSCAVLFTANQRRAHPLLAAGDARQDFASEAPRDGESYALASEACLKPANSGKGGETHAS